MIGALRLSMVGEISADNILKQFFLILREK